MATPRPPEEYSLVWQSEGGEWSHATTPHPHSLTLLWVSLGHPTENAAACVREGKVGYRVFPSTAPEVQVLDAVAMRVDALQMAAGEGLFEWGED